MPRKKTGKPKGGQPGNTNAMIHGFYSEQFRKAELNDLNNLDLTNIESEINLLRVFMRRTFVLAEDVEDLGTAISTLYALAMAASKISILALRQNTLQGGQDERISSALHIALEQVVRELNLDEQE